MEHKINPFGLFSVPGGWSADPIGLFFVENQTLSRKMKVMMEQGAQLSSSERDVETFNKRVGERLRCVRTDMLRMSIAEMASTFGVGTSTIQRYENGERTPDAYFLMQVAERAEVTISSLFGQGGDGDAASPKGPTEAAQAWFDTKGNPVDVSEFVFIPRYNVKASAGHGAAPGADKPPLPMAFRRYWIDNFLGVNPRNLAVIAVKGDSMEGVLSNRDVILVNQADCKPGTGLYVLRMDGDLFVKRVQRLPGETLEVTSANEAYRPFTIDMTSPPGDFEIIGRVVWAGRQM